MKPGSFPVKDSLTGEGSPGAGQLPPLVEIRNVTSYCPGACKAQPSQAHRLRTLSGSTPWMAGSPTEGPLSHQQYIRDLAASASSDEESHTEPRTLFN